MAIDSYNPRIVWLATTAGDVLKSTDAGLSWSSSHQFHDQVLALMVSGADTRRVFAATRGSGVWRTDDGGENWIDLSENYKEFSGSKDFKVMTQGVSDPQTVILATKFGLLRSTDFGDTWDKIDLLTPAGSTVIYSVAIDPKDPNMLYYGTATTFYRSPNGGVNWIPKKLPTTRAATALHVDAANSSLLYMGVTRFKN